MRAPVAGAAAAGRDPVPIGWGNVECVCLHAGEAPAGSVYVEVFLVLVQFRPHPYLNPIYGLCRLHWEGLAGPPIVFGICPPFEKNDVHAMGGRSRRGGDAAALMGDLTL